jgi:hypothetical protein
MTKRRAPKLIAIAVALLLSVRPTGRRRKHKPRPPTAILAEILSLGAICIFSFTASFCFAGAFLISGSDELRGFAASVAFATLAVFGIVWIRLVFELEAFAESDAERVFSHRALRLHPAANDH